MESLVLDLLWLPRVIDLLHAHPCEPLTLQQLADDAGVHPAHLARTFRRCTGLTVGAFLRDVRLARARRQIVETGLTLARIAAENGFADQSHLCARRVLYDDCHAQAHRRPPRCRARRRGIAGRGHAQGRRCDRRAALRGAAARARASTPARSR